MSGGAMSCDPKSTKFRFHKLKFKPMNVQSLNKS